MRIRIPALIDVLHPSQREVFARLKRFSVLQIGRRWGKTTFGEQIAMEDVVRGRLVGWFAPSYKYLADPVRHFERALGQIVRKHDRVEKRMEFATGGALDFWTLEDVDSGRGRKYHRIIVDEAGFAPNLLESWRASIRPTLADYKGSALFLGTPKGTNDFHRLFAQAEQDESGEWAAFRIGSSANPFLDPSEIDAARRMMPPEVAAQEFDAIPAEDGGNPFGLDAIRKCVGPISTAAPEAWGVDLAKSQDWTAAIALDASGTVCRCERWQAAWNVTRERLARTIGQAPAQIDSTGVGDPIVEDLKRACRKVEGFKFTSQSKQQLMEGLQIAISTGEIRIPDGWLRAELDAFGFRYSGRTVAYEAMTGHDDGVCALALAVHCRRTRRPLVLKVF